MTIRVHPWLRLALCLLPFAYLWVVLINQLRIPWNTNPQYAYGWAVPFLCLYLIWNRIQKSEVGRRKSEGGDQNSDAASPLEHLGASTIQQSNGSSLTPNPRSSSGSCHSWFPASFSAFSFQLSAFVFCALLYAPIRLVQEANPGWSLVSWPLAILVIGLTLLFIHFSLQSTARSSSHPSSIFHLPSSSFQLSAFLFPLAFFLVAVPWPYAMENALIQGLTRLNTAMTIEIIGWLGIPALQHGNVIELATGSVGIDEACSGIRSLQATLMLSLFFGELYRRSVKRRVLCVLAGFAIAMACNLVRMLLLTWVAARKGEQAIAGWHDPAGITILLACFIGVWLFASHQSPRGREKTVARDPVFATRHSPPIPLTSDFAREPSVSSQRPSSSLPSVLPSPRRGEGQGEVNANTDRGNPSAVEFHCAADALHPPRTSDQSRRPWHFALYTSCIILAVWLAFVEVGVAAWYRHVESGNHDFATWHIAWPEDREGFREIPVPARAAEMLRYDKARQAQWVEADGTRWQLSWFYWQPGQAAGYLAKSHNPLVCMPAAGYEVLSTSSVQQADVHGLRFPFRIYSFGQDGAKVYILYSRWDDRAAEQSFATEGLSRFNRLRSVWTGRGNHGQRVITMSVWGAPTAEAARTSLLQQLERLFVVDHSSIDQ